MNRLALAVTATACALCLGAPVAAQPASDWGRIELIGAELFGVDTAHSSIGFTIGLLGLTTVRGAFRQYRGAILYDEKDPTRSSAMFVIDASSIDTGLDVRDQDLKGPRFFDVEKYPKIVFQSQQIDRTGRDRYVVHGTLKMHGVERKISLPMTQTVARMPDSAWGNLRVGGAGSLTLRRTDFGILGGEFWGLKALSDQVEIEIAILGNRFNFEKWSFDARAKPSVGEEMWKALAVNGVEAAVTRFRDLKQKNPNGYNFATDEVALVGNRLLQHRRLKEALQIFQLAAHESPMETTILARMGETSAAMGDQEAARAAYHRVLELAPDHPEAIEMLQRLEKPQATSKWENGSLSEGPARQETSDRRKDHRASLKCRAAAALLMEEEHQPVTSAANRGPGFAHR